MAIVFLVFASFAFALGIVVAKPAMNCLGLRLFLTVRVATGLSGALVLWLSSGCPWTIGVDHLLLVISSLMICPVLLNLLFFAVLARGEVGSVNALRFTAPLWAALITFLWWFEVPAIPGALCFSLIVLGVIVLMRGRRASSTSRLAMVLAMASGASQGGSLLLQQAALGVLSREELLLYQNGAFALVLALWTLAAPRSKTGQPSPSRPTTESPDRARTVGVALAILSGLMVYVIGELLKFLALPDVSGPMAVSIIQLSLPFSTLLAHLLLSERPGFQELTGIALISLGSVLAPLLLAG